MIPADACQACRHPWGWHPLPSTSPSWGGCVGRVAQLLAGTSRRCDCQAIRPGHVHRVAGAQPPEPITESEARALWGDR